MNPADVIQACRFNNINFHVPYDRFPMRITSQRKFEVLAIPNLVLNRGFKWRYHGVAHL